jgi:polyisoprenoid-binding protein YceI
LASTFLQLTTSSAQSFTLNAKGSSIAFTISNFGIDVEGSFADVQGIIKFSETDLGASGFDIEVDAKSISTGIALRDKHLRNETYFDVQKYEKMSFRSKSVKSTAPGKYVAVGNLTIKNQTREIEIPFQATASQNAIVLDGGFILDRKLFGIGKNSLMMGDEVTVRLHVVADLDPL